MKRVLALIAVLTLSSLPLAADGFLVNDSGESATALRVTFSEPVTITGFGDTFMDVSPSGESVEFTFSGGEVESRGTHWLNWEPEGASILAANWCLIENGGASANQVLSIEDVEYLGNPFRERYPDGSGWEHARAVWDQQVLGDRIYFAHGSMNSNAGPIDVWYYDLHAGEFVNAFAVDEEEIRWLRTDGSGLLVPGADATESWEFGNFYTYDGNVWDKHRTIPLALHVTDVLRFGDEIFAAYSTHWYDDADELRIEGAVARSADGGQTWEEIYRVSDNLIGRFFVLNDRLYASHQSDRVLEYDGEAFLEIKGGALFLGEETISSASSRNSLWRDVSFLDGMAYIGVTSYRTHSALRFTRSIDPADCLDVDVGLREGEELFDIVRAGEALLVLTNEPRDVDRLQMGTSNDPALLSGGGCLWDIRVYATADLENWQKVAHFSSPAPAYSLEFVDGEVYIALGPGHPHTGFYETGVGSGRTLGDNNSHSGEVYRFPLSESVTGSVPEPEWPLAQTAPEVEAPNQEPEIDPTRPVETHDLGTSIHGMEERRGELVALDWKNGAVYRVGTSSWEAIRGDAELPPSLMDFVIKDGTLYAGLDNTGESILGYDLESGAPRSSMSLPSGTGFVSNELWGIELDNDVLYLLGWSELGQRLVVYDLASGALNLDVNLPATLPELIGLEYSNGRLFTFGWGEGTVYEFALDGESSLYPVANLHEAVPAGEIAPGGLRGLHLGSSGIYLSSVSGGGHSRVHRVPYPDGFWVNGFSNGAPEEGDPAPANGEQQSPGLGQGEASEATDDSTSSCPPGMQYQSEEFEQAQLLAIDGFSVGSVPIGWWYSSSMDSGTREFTSLTPEGGHAEVIYQFPEDGDSGLCLQMSESTDLSDYDGVELHMRANHPIAVALEIHTVCGTSDEWIHYRLDLSIQCEHQSTGIRVPFNAFTILDDWRAEYPSAPEHPDPRCFRTLCFIVEVEGIQLAVESAHVYRIADQESGVAQPGALAMPGVDGYAVILEVDDYEDDAKDIDIDYINRDRIVDVLIELGWAEENMIVMLDRDVTVDAVKDAMSWLIERVTEEDLVLIYASGHGYEYMGQVVGLGWALPPLWQMLPTDRKLFFMQSCHAGEITGSVMYGGFVPPQQRAEETAVLAPGLALASCMYDERSMTGMKGTPVVGGYMTYFLCGALGDMSLDKNGDSFVSVEEAFPETYMRTREHYKEAIAELLAIPDLPDDARRDFLQFIETDYPHPELIDGYPGELILDLRYYRANVTE